MYHRNKSSSKLNQQRINQVNQSHVMVNRDRSSGKLLSGILTVA
jgi:hypothetical protein